MTGFENWIMAGLDLGAGWICQLVDEVQLEIAKKYRIQLPEITRPIMAEVVEEVSRRIQAKWPPWKREFTKQKDLKLTAQGGDGICDRCESFYPARLLHTTPVGDLCAHCLGDYIRELNIQDSKGD